MTHATDPEPGGRLLAFEPDELATHVRHTTLVRLSAAELRQLHPLRHLLTVLEERAFSTDPTRYCQPTVELQAITRDLRCSLSHLHLVETFPLGQDDHQDYTPQQLVAARAYCTLEILIEWLEARVGVLPDPSRPSRTRRG
jgi:hypothetical protein